MMDTLSPCAVNTTLRLPVWGKTHPIKQVLPKRRKTQLMRGTGRQTGRSPEGMWSQSGVHQAAHLSEVDLLAIEHMVPSGLHTPGLGLGREDRGVASPTGATQSSSPHQRVGIAFCGVIRAGSAPLPAQTSSTEGFWEVQLRGGGDGRLEPSTAKGQLQRFTAWNKNCSRFGGAGGPSCGSRYSLGGELKRYQVHQHLHLFLRHQVLGVIHQDMPIVGVEVQAVRNSRSH